MKNDVERLEYIATWIAEWARDLLPEGSLIMVIATDYRPPPPSLSQVASNLATPEIGADILRSAHRGLLGVSMPDGRGMHVSKLTKMDGIDITIIGGPPDCSGLAVQSSLERNDLEKVVGDLYQMACRSIGQEPGG